MPGPFRKRSLTGFAFLSSLCKGAAPDDIGIHGDSLSDCPSSPNCVVSHPQANEKHRIDPLPIYRSKTESIALLDELVKAMPRTKVVERQDNYLRVEFSSRLFRFVDDVEFYVPDSSDKVHVRSASRIGYSDMGVNRKRVESIRKEYTARKLCSP